MYILKDAVKASNMKGNLNSIKLGKKLVLIDELKELQAASNRVRAISGEGGGGPNWWGYLPIDPANWLTLNPNPNPNLNT